ncbi:MAG: T9SS type A sorting domain-containing protein [Bacteroidales bacterium]|nr:T9SS type A sorting domain-containing protein [Bacteroidales bacterium]
MAVPSLHARSTWESTRAERAAEAKQVMRSSELEVKASRGVIYVTTSRPVQVKVFSILGQLISQETIAAGTSRLQLASHGIFIVKIGDVTCKVAL